MRIMLAAVFGAWVVHAAEVARIEIHVLQSDTMTDEQFLTGARGARATSLAAELRLPTPGSTRLPTVILLHGSNGLSGSGDLWAREFNDQGFATLRIDSFTGRGIVSTAGDQSQLGELAMVYDAYRGYDLLTRHSRIDPARIVLFGSSRGGVGSLYASVDRFRRMHATPGADFAAYIALYPMCARTYIDDATVSQRPIRILHGTADVIAPIQQCRSYAQRLQRAGANVRLIEYEGAHHGFDSRVNVSLSSSPETADGRRAPGCDLFEEPEGRIMNRATGALFTRADGCLKRPRFTSYHEGAHMAATRDVRELLAEVLAQRR